MKASSTIAFLTFCSVAASCKTDTTPTAITTVLYVDTGKSRPPGGVGISMQAPRTWKVVEELGRLALRPTDDTIGIVIELRVALASCQDAGSQDDQEKPEPQEACVARVAGEQREDWTVAEERQIQGGGVSELLTKAFKGSDHTRVLVVVPTGRHVVRCRGQLSDEWMKLLPAYRAACESLAITAGDK